MLDGLAHVAYLELDFITAIELWERAYGRYRAEGECVRVVTVARASGLDVRDGRRRLGGDERVAVVLPRP